MKPDGEKLERFKSVNMRASHVVSHIDTTTSLRTIIGIERVGGNRKKLLSAASDICVLVRKRR